MKAGKAFFVAVGSELLSFKANRYSPVLAGKLFKAGYTLAGEITAADRLEDIKKAMDFAQKNADIVIVTGGLGPTFDDLTRQAAASLFNLSLHENQKVKKTLQKRYPHLEKWNLENQSLVLEKAEVFDNPNGTAFAQVLKMKGKTFAFLPGPLKEWEPIWDEKVSKIIANKKQKIYFKNFRLAGLREAQVQEKAMPVIKEFARDIECTVLAGPYTCEFSFYCSGRSIFRKAGEKLSNIFAEYVYSSRDFSLAAELKELCIKKKVSVSLAESCTGGLVSQLITSEPGSSEFYAGGINAYSNSAKKNILAVSQQTLKKHGAVSRECAIEMARGAKKIFKTDFSASITGIAGPMGGTKDKPVGTVCFGFCGPDSEYSAVSFFRKDRDFIRQSSANFALFALLKLVKSYRG